MKIKPYLVIRNYFNFKILIIICSLLLFSCNALLKVEQGLNDYNSMMKTYDSSRTTKKQIVRCESCNGTGLYIQKKGYEHIKCPTCKGAGVVYSD